MSAIEPTVVSIDDLLKDTEEPTELYFFPPVKGHVKITGITTGKAYDSLISKVRLAIAAGKRNAPPYAGMTQEAIARVKWAEAGIVEPSLTTQQVLRLNELYGTALQQLVGRVMALSGISQDDLTDREEEMEENPLLEPDASVPGVPAPPS